VIAGKPAMDAEALPIGPQALCRMVRSAADCLDLSEEHRLIFFRTFDRQVMPMYGHLVESINSYLAKKGVLPYLQYVPVRARPTAQGAEKDMSPIAKAERGSTLPPAPSSLGLSIEPQPQQRSARADLRASAVEAGEDGRPELGVTPQFGRAAASPPADAFQEDAPAVATPGEYEAAPQRRGSDLAPAADVESFMQMRQLLAGRRQLLGKLNPDRTGTEREAAREVSTEQVQQVLGRLQNRPASPVMVNGRPATRSIQHLKQDLLAQLRQQSPDHQPASLAEEDGDAIDLVAMLFDSINKDVRPNSAAATLLSKLQVPLLRVALQDKQFFTRQQHPARLMLNTIAETSAYFLSDEEHDEALLGKMNAVVDRTVRDFDGDLGLFHNLLEDLSNHLQTVSRKAEVAERRHVEAARGREKLAMAREHASGAVEALLKNQNLPRFTHTLLNQAWTDVMALTSLRHGEDSETWRQQLGVAERLIAIARENRPTPPPDAAELRHEIESSLAQVGYQADEVAAIAQRLVAPGSGSEDDAASRTELTMRLKARARLGADQGAKPERATLSGAEQAQYEALKHVPFGSWFEFITNQQGDRIRRRLSWFSPMTGHVLFVNHRGQKIGEHTLDGLARLMVRGEVRRVEEEKESLIDRAWNSVVSALRSFAGQAAAPEAAR
jgi:hypothetical protein